MSPERPLQQAHWPFVGFGQPRFCDGEHLVSAAWELLFSDTGKALRLCIINVTERSSFRRLQKTGRPRVDAAEIEALHGMHVYQWPPAVPRRCVTFGRASGQLGEAEPTAELTAVPRRCPPAEPTAGPTAEPLAEPTPDAAAA